MQMELFFLTPQENGAHQEKKIMPNFLPKNICTRPQDGFQGFGQLSVQSFPQFFFPSKLFLCESLLLIAPKMIYFFVSGDAVEMLEINIILVCLQIYYLFFQSDFRILFSMFILSISYGIYSGLTLHGCFQLNVFYSFSIPESSSLLFHKPIISLYFLFFPVFRSILLEIGIFNSVFSFIISVSFFLPQCILKSLNLILNIFFVCQLHSSLPLILSIAFFI